MDLIKIKKGEVELEVTKRAYEIVYAGHGFSVVDNKKTTSRKKHEPNNDLGN